jgi:hypothetical protein
MRCKVGETNVSFNKDLSPPPTWRGDGPSVAVNWTDMFGSPLSLLCRSAEVSSTREKGVGSGSQLGARPT